MCIDHQMIEHDANEIADAASSETIQPRSTEASKDGHDDARTIAIKEPASSPLLVPRGASTTRA